jgi:hypothetical protein
MGLAMSFPFLLVNEPSAAEEAKLNEFVIVFEPLPMATEYVFPPCGSWLTIALIRRYIITTGGVAYL